MTPDPQVVKRLVWYFHRNGYVRQLDEVRRILEGQSYKKGAELRLVANTPEELTEIRGLLQSAGFQLGKPFIKASSWRQPVYGVAAVTRFLTLVKSHKSK